MKGLHEFASNQVKELIVAMHREKFETEHYVNAIKELQQQSDEKAIVGKLQHKLMVSHFNQAQVNIKYDSLIHELEREKTTVNTLEADVMATKNDALESREILRQKIADYENSLTEVKLKIIPSITLEKVNEMNLQINELSNNLMHLEIYNKKLRDENHELASNCQSASHVLTLPSLVS